MLRVYFLSAQHRSFIHSVVAAMAAYASGLYIFRQRNSILCARASASFSSTCASPTLHSIRSTIIDIIIIKVPTLPNATRVRNSRT